MIQVRKLTLVQWYWLNYRLYSYFSTPSLPTSSFCSSPWRAHIAVGCHISLVSLPCDSFSVCLQSCRNLIFLSQLRYKMPPMCVCLGLFWLLKFSMSEEHLEVMLCPFQCVSSGVHRDDKSCYWWTLSIWLRWYLSGFSTIKLLSFPLQIMFVSAEYFETKVLLPVLRKIFT